MRGRDIEKYGLKQQRWLINTHNGLRSENLPPVNVEVEYPAVFKHLSQYEVQLKNRGDQGVHWSNLRNCAYLREFEKPKIIFAQLTDQSKMTIDEIGTFGNAKTLIITGHDLYYLLALLNSPSAEWYYYQISTTTGVGTNQWSKDKLEVLPIKLSSESDKLKLENLSKYLLYIKSCRTEDLFKNIDNRKVFDLFFSVINHAVAEVYFKKELQDKGLTILNLINDKTFPDISEMSPEEKKATIQKVYYELQQKDNPIRNRILVSESRSEIIRRINEVTS